MLNGKYYTIDAHCHIYPAKIAELAVGHTRSFYGMQSSHNGTAETLLSLGEKSGIDMFVVQSVATTPKQVRSINEFISQSVAESDGKFFGLGTLHPESESISDDIKHLMSLGLHGVKLHPDIQQFKSDDYRCLEIYEECEKYGLPILIHTGDYRYDYSNPNRVLPLLQTYTKLTFVGAHLGGWSIFDEAVDIYAGMENFYVDTSSTLGFMKNPNHAKDIILKYGTDKVLFGSDYPMWDPQTEMNNLLKLGLSDDDYRKIFSENAKKAYGIK